MADFTVRSDNVDVEQIMRQIRMRIKEKRGVDYTEEEVRELANVKLEKFLNPRAVRSELVEHYRRQRPTTPPATPPPPENYGFEESTIYESHRGALSWIRKLLNPILKLFFNPNPIIQVLNRQGRMNEYVLQHFNHIGQRFGTRDELDALNFEVLNNIVLEMTRLSIEVKNLRMQIDSMNARQEFNERRARAFEGIVAAPAAAPPAPGVGNRESRESVGAEEEGDANRARRRRRRRGRRRPDSEGGGTQAGGSSGPSSEGTQERESRHEGQRHEGRETPVRGEVGSGRDSADPSAAPPSSDPGDEQ